MNERGPSNGSSRAATQKRDSTSTLLVPEGRTGTTEEKLKGDIFQLSAAAKK